MSHDNSLLKFSCEKLVSDDSPLQTVERHEFRLKVILLGGNSDRIFVLSDSVDRVTRQIIPNMEHTTHSTH